MTAIGYKRLTITISVLCITLLVICGYQFWNYGLLKIRVAWADDQVKIFDEMRTKALQSDARGAVGYLQYIVNYYPSGTKQEAGSRLDRMVERERDRSTQEIVEHLRAKTGENLGESPQAWIQKYANR